MVPPNVEASKRFSAMLWAYVQNNSSLKSDTSNRHHSAWSRQTLVQRTSAGGLNSQEFTSQMTAIHAK
jgi:hypothetical protein